MAVQPGQKFDRYSIEEMIGEGGMGRVYRAFDTRLERRVAVKVLNDTFGESDAVAVALREARAAAAITHPNATAIYDAHEIDGTCFIVMELVSGTSLRSIIGGSAKPIPLATRLRWLIDVAAALGAAHRMGVVHRDVKPENVMVRHDGLVKVLDFGVARRTLIEAGPSAAAVTFGSGSRIAGTPAYMAPEQIRGEALDGRADQFGWAVLAYELITGRLPWKTAKEVVGYIAAVITEEPAPPSSLAPEVPPGIDAALLRALSKNPNERFPTIVAAALELVPFAKQSLAMSAVEMPVVIDKASEIFGSEPTVAISDASEAIAMVRTPTELDADSIQHTAAPVSQAVVPPVSQPTAPPVSQAVVPPVSQGPVSASSALAAGREPPPSSRPHRPAPPSSGKAMLSESHRRPMTTVRSSVPAISVKPASGGRPIPAATASTPERPAAPAAVPAAALPATLRDPDFEAPVDIEAHLDALPPEATCKGLFFLDVLQRLSKSPTEVDVFRAAQLPARRYVAFRDYSLGDAYRLTLAATRVLFPRYPLGEGLRRMGQSTFDAVLTTHIGRSLFGILGTDVEPILLTGPKAFKLLVSIGQVTAEKTAPRVFTFRVQEFPAFLETYQVGVLEGVLRHCKQHGKVRIAVQTLSAATLEVKLL